MGDRSLPGALRTALIVVLSTLLVVLIGLAGWLLVAPSSRTEVFSAELAHNPPWREGERHSPVSTKANPDVASIARAQQYEDAVRAAGLVGEDSQVGPVLSFDRLQRRGEASDIPPGTLGGVQVYRREQSLSTTTVSVTEFATGEQAETADGDQRHPTGRELELTLPGATRTSLVAAAATSSPCRVAEPTSLALSAVLDGRLLLRIDQGCLAGADTETRAAELVQLARTAARAGRDVLTRPVPDSYLPSSASYPILASDRWSDREWTIPDTAPDPVAVPGYLRQTPPTLVFQGLQRVYVMPDITTAERAMDAIAQISPEDEDLAESPTSRPPGAGEERLCAPPVHWQLGTTCWSRIGRFLVVGTIEAARDRSDAGELDERQVEALRGIR